MVVAGANADEAKYGGKKKAAKNKTQEKRDEDAVTASPTLPGKTKAKKGKGKKPKTAEDSEAAGDEDVEGEGRISREAEQLSVISLDILVVGAEPVRVLFLPPYDETLLRQRAL